MTLKVVQLRQEPLLNDIPGQLRAFADAVERGDYGAPEFASMLLVTQDAYRPAFFGWGAVPNRYGLAGLYALAQHLVMTDAGADE